MASTVEQIGMMTDDGCVIQASGGLVAFYGGTPVAQQVIAAVATTDLGTTGILAGLNKINSLISILGPSYLNLTTTA